MCSLDTLFGTFWFILLNFYASFFVLQILMMMTATTTLTMTTVLSGIRAVWGTVSRVQRGPITTILNEITKVTLIASKRRYNIIRAKNWQKAPINRHQKKKMKMKKAEQKRKAKNGEKNNKHPNKLK